MPRKLYKRRLLLDENMPPRQRFPRLNGRFDVKHIRDDLHTTGIKDPAVYEMARIHNRLIITFNGDDFRKLVTGSNQTGAINVSANLRDDQIDTKLTALLTKRGKSSFYGELTQLTAETDT
jgi:predicted nuclease of predicted toxin-antitoxin system